MITCPNCGAGNKEGSSTCRMCAASLEGAAEPAAARAQHAASEVSRHQEEAKPTVEQEGIACPECGTMNEPGWSFCQQCGKRLTKPAAPPAQQPFTPGVADLRTVAEQRAVPDPALQGLKTNPEPQPAERSYKTVVAQPPPLERQVVEERQEPAPAPPPKPATPPPSPTVVARPSRPGVSKPDIPPPTPPLESPAQLRPTAPTPPLNETPMPLTPSPETVVEPVGSPSGILCTQCGQSNSIGSAFCASCGAPMTFGKTMVISSQSAPPKGSLHLVMEGGQPGEVYEIGDETVIGRTNGAITFPHDGFMSGRHARVERRGSTFILCDEGSRNGTFIKIREEVELKPGDMVLVGKQLFRFEVEK